MDRDFARRWTYWFKRVVSTGDYTKIRRKKMDADIRHCIGQATLQTVMESQGVCPFSFVEPRLPKDGSFSAQGRIHSAITSETLLVECQWQGLQEQSSRACQRSPYSDRDSIVHTEPVVPCEFA